MTSARPPVLANGVISEATNAMCRDSAMEFLRYQVLACLRGTRNNRMIDGRSRRKFLARLAGTAGGAIIGLDPETRSWSSDTKRRLAKLPRLGGTLNYDDAVLDEVSQDNGRIVRRRPLAVLRPGGPDDIVKMVRYANTHRLKVAMRGQ